MANLIGRLARAPDQYKFVPTEVKLVAEVPYTNATSFGRTLNDLQPVDEKAEGKGRLFDTYA
jgi:hypothetical protein